MSFSDEYVAGDVNTIDGYDESTTPVSAPVAEATLRYIATQLADDASAVTVDLSEKSGKVVLALGLAADDIGRMIGRRGRTAQALRAVVAAAGSRDGVTTTVDILD